MKTREESNSRANKALNFIVTTFWSALTCQRFRKRRLVAALQISLYYFLDQRRQFRRRCVAYFIGRLNSRGRPLTTIRTITIDHADLIAGAQLVTDLDLGQETDGRIDLIFHAHAAHTGLGYRVANLFGFNFNDKS